MVRVDTDPESRYFCGCLHYSNNTAELSAVPHILTRVLRERRQVIAQASKVPTIAVSSQMQYIRRRAAAPETLILAYDSQYTRGYRTTNLGHWMGRNYKIYSGTCMLCTLCDTCLYFVGARTTNLGHWMGRNYKIYSGTCMLCTLCDTCHGRHASGISARRRGGAAGGPRGIGTERGPQELDTSLAARLPRIV
eukprot:SAG31_NODE_3415_length_4302_cov_12.564359_4_plen_192_part_01